jgi:hypothetical protein
MRRLCIAGVSILPLAFGFVLMWRNINVKTIKQVKGTVVKAVFPYDGYQIGPIRGSPLAQHDGRS